jgi:hypothetical protein
MVHRPAWGAHRTASAHKLFLFCIAVIFVFQGSVSAKRAPEGTLQSQDHLSSEELLADAIAIRCGRTSDSILATVGYKHDSNV